MGNCYSRKNVKKSITADARLLVHIVGGPCSGKSSVSSHVSKVFNLITIAPDTLIRQCVYHQTLKEPSEQINKALRGRFHAYNAQLMHTRMKGMGLHWKQEDSAGTYNSGGHLPFVAKQKEENSGNYSHVFRQIQRSSKFGDPINGDVTASLVHECIRYHWYEIAHMFGFVIDGYPRNPEQLAELMMQIGKAHIIVYLKCEDDVMMKRALARAEESQRYDDNEPFLKMKIRSFNNNMEEMLAEWDTLGVTVLTINGNEELHEVKKEVDENIRHVINRIGKRKFSRSKYASPNILKK